MVPPETPQLLPIPLPTVEPRRRPAASSLRGIINNLASRLAPSRPGPSLPTAEDVHPVLAHGLLYDASTNPGTFRTPDDRTIPAAILDEPAASAYPRDTAALMFIGTGSAGVSSVSFIRCRDVVAVRDVLDAIQAALQGSAFARQTGAVRILVQSPSVGDFRVLLSV